MEKWHDFFIDIGQKIHRTFHVGINNKHKGISHGY